MAKLKSGTRIYGTATVDSNLVVSAGGVSVAGPSTFTGITTCTTTLFSRQLAVAGVVTATSFVGDGINLTNTGSTLSAASGSQRVVLTSLTTGTMTASSTTASLIYDANTNVLNTPSVRTTGVSTFAGITTVRASLFGSQASFTGIVSATSFVGDGANLTNTGASLSAGSGSQRVVLTSLTSGTMVSAATSSALLFNSTTGTLSATIFTSLSDKTLKTNIKPITNALDLVKKINGVKYDWKDGNRGSIGVIAQEIEEILPEVVNTDENGLKTVSYGNIVAILIEAIKEQQIIIEELNKKVSVGINSSHA